MNISYEVKKEKPFNEVVDGLKKQLEASKFGVLWELNFKDKLEEKGFEFNTNFKIFEVCNPAQAAEVLSKRIEAGYFLPCKLVVYEKEGSVYIGMMKPIDLIKMLGYDELLDIAQSVENTLSKAIDNV